MVPFGSLVAIKNVCVYKDAVQGSKIVQTSATAVCLHPSGT